MSKPRKLRPLTVAGFDRLTRKLVGPGFSRPIRQPYKRLSKAELKAIIERLRSPWLDV
jgi:hypothetical protein